MKLISFNQYKNTKPKGKLNRKKVAIIITIVVVIIILAILTSIYMLNRVIPMLPRELSNGICSLNEGQDRYTLSVSMEIDNKGKIISSEVYKGILNVTRRM